MVREYQQWDVRSIPNNCPPTPAGTLRFVTSSSSMWQAAEYRITQIFLILATKHQNRKESPHDSER